MEELPPDAPTTKKRSPWYAIAIALMALAGLFLRLDRLSDQPYWMDEGYTVNAIISQMTNGTRHLASVLDSGQTYFCTLYCAPTQLIVQLFGRSPSSFRLLAAVFGILFVGLCVILSEKIFKDRRVTLLTTLFASFSYWQIAWSREARWYTMFAFFLWLAMLFAYLAIQAETRKKTFLYIGATFVSAAIAALVHQLGYLLFPILVLWFLIAFKNALRIRTVLIALALSALAFFGIEAFLGFGFIRAIMGIRLHYTLPYYLSFYLHTYWLLIAFTLYGFFSCKKEDRKKYYCLLLPFVMYLIALSFLTNIVQYRYLFAPVAAFFLTAAAGIIAVFDDIRKKSSAAAWGACAIVIALFFVSGEGILRPQSFYFLESDPASAQSRPYWGYTPQPNFNAAYAFIKSNLKSGDVVISSHPHFNKIFLNQPGYWIEYDYLGFGNKAQTVVNNREYYVGAQVLSDLDQLKQLTTETHGYVVFDYMAADNRIPQETLDYIRTTFSQVFYDKINDYSQIWVYRF